MFDQRSTDWSSNTLGHKMSLLGICLTKGQPGWSSNTLGHKMSLPGGYIRPEVSLTELVTHLATRCLSWAYVWPKVNLAEVVTHLAIKCLCQEGTSDQRSTWLMYNTFDHKMSLLEVNLTKGHHDLKPYYMATWLVASSWGVCLAQKSTWLK